MGIHMGICSNRMTKTQAPTKRTAILTNDEQSTAVRTVVENHRISVSCHHPGSTPLKFLIEALKDLFEESDISGKRKQLPEVSSSSLDAIMRPELSSTSTSGAIMCKLCFRTYKTKSFSRYHGAG